MKSRKIPLKLFWLLIPLFVLIAGVRGQETQPQKRRFVTSYSGGDLPSIDTALAENPASIQVVEEMTVGLFRQDESDGSLQMGMAQAYALDNDDTRLVVKIRAGVPWVRYDSTISEVLPVMDCAGEVRTVSAHDFVYGIQRTLDPETASPYAFLISKVIDGAAAFNEGRSTDFSKVGVKALDDLTLEIHFIEANTFNLNIPGLWMMHAQPRWLIEGDACNESVGDSWTESEHYQGYGPFTLAHWIHEDSLLLVKNPFWPALETIPQPELDEVQIMMINESMALAAYEAGNLDESVIPTGDYDRILSDPAFDSHRIFKPFNIGTETLMYNIHLAPTDDLRVRQALTLALDRDKITAAVKSGEPARFYLNPLVNGAPSVEKFAEKAAVYNPEAAKALISSYCEEKGIQPQDLTITYSFSISDLHRIRAEVIAAMWHETLGVQVELVSSEWTVFSQKRKEGLQNVYRTAWIQDYLDANNFTADVFLCPGGYYQESSDWPTIGCVDYEQADPLYSEYAELVTAAAHEQDPARRKALYADSEDILINRMALLNPVSWNNAWMLRNPRFEAPISRIGYERWEKWRVSTEIEE